MCRGTSRSVPGRQPLTARAVGTASPQIRTLRREIPGAIADLTGELFTGQITEGSTDRDRDGWLTVVAVRSADDPEQWERNDGFQVVQHMAYTLGYARMLLMRLPLFHRGDAVYVNRTAPRGCG